MNEAADGGELWRLAVRRTWRRAIAKRSFCRKCSATNWCEAFREFKSIWDPDWKMNPGKIVDPIARPKICAWAPDYNPPQPETHFQYPEDKGNFGRSHCAASASANAAADSQNHVPQL